MRCQAEVSDLVTLIQASLRECPACAAVLPDDPEVQAWTQQHEKLVKLRDEAMRRRTEAVTRAPSRLEAARFEGPTGTVALLEREERNLINKLEGRGPAEGWKGGISRVL